MALGLIRVLGSVLVGALVSTAAIAADGGKFINKSDTLKLKEFGAFCDGVHDDTKAIQRWLNSIGSHLRLVAPAGVCLFSAPLHVPYANDWTIEGSGPYSTVLKYVGDAKNVDLLTISDTAHGGFKGGSFRDLRIVSDTKMNSGAALHVHGAFVSMFRNLVIGGFESKDTIDNGFWFDGVGFTTLIGFDAKGHGDGVRVNAALGGAADLYLTSGRVGGFAIGLHVAGGMGGVQCDQTDFLKNGISLKIDNSVTHLANREVKQGPNCAFDSATSGDNVLIDDRLANGGTIRLDGWIASSYHASGIHVSHWKDGDIELTGDKLYNNCLDGLFVEDSSTHIFIASTLGIKSNGNSLVGGGACGSVPNGRGWGVNAAVPTNNIFTDAIPWNNHAGSFAPNSRIERLGPNGYLKHANGLIDYWGIVTIPIGDTAAMIKDGSDNEPACGRGWLRGTLKAVLQDPQRAYNKQPYVVIEPSGGGLLLKILGASGRQVPFVISWSGKCRPSA